MVALHMLRMTDLSFAMHESQFFAVHVPLPCTHNPRDLCGLRWAADPMAGKQLVCRVDLLGLLDPSGPEWRRLRPQ